MSTVYSYQVGAYDDEKSEWNWSAVYEFHTGSKRKEFSFLAIADIVGFCRSANTRKR